MPIDALMSTVVLHVPHSSTLIPEADMDQFVVPRDVLKSELVRMTDHLTLELFGGVEHPGPVIAAAVSRLVVDVERFSDDADEPMVAKGMGAIYTRLADGGPLRRTVSAEERQRLFANHYAPHHARFSSAVKDVLVAHKYCLIIDAHSFPSKPLPYELDQNPNRAEVCIGTDPFHTPAFVCHSFVEGFKAHGFTVSVDRPFAGAIVPQNYYRQDVRVLSVMVEINRGLYINEKTALSLPDFPRVAARIQAAIRSAVESIHEEMGR